MCPPMAAAAAPRTVLFVLGHPRKLNRTFRSGLSLLVSANLRKDNPQHSQGSPGPVLVGGSAQQYAGTGGRRRVLDLLRISPNRIPATLHEKVRFLEGGRDEDGAPV